MEMNKLNKKMKCDFYGCNNLAQYSFSTKGLLKRDLCFCGDCLKEMYQIIAKNIIPKGIESPFNTKRRLKNEKN